MVSAPPFRILEVCSIWRSSQWGLISSIRVGENAKKSPTSAPKSPCGCLAQRHKQTQNHQPKNPNQPKAPTTLYKPRNHKNPRKEKRPNKPLNHKKSEKRQTNTPKPSSRRHPAHPPLQKKPKSKQSRGKRNPDKEPRFLNQVPTVHLKPETLNLSRTLIQ